MKSCFLSSRMAVSLVFLLVCGTVFGQTKSGVKRIDWERPSWGSSNGFRSDLLNDRISQPQTSGGSHLQVYLDKGKVVMYPEKNGKEKWVDDSQLYKYRSMMLPLNRALSSRTPGVRYVAGIAMVLVGGFFIKDHPILAGCIFLIAVIYGLIWLLVRRFKNNKARTGSS